MEAVSEGVDCVQEAFCNRIHAQGFCRSSRTARAVQSGRFSQRGAQDSVVRSKSGDSQDVKVSQAVLVRRQDLQWVLIRSAALSQDLDPYLWVLLRVGESMERGRQGLGDFGIVSIALRGKRNDVVDGGQTEDITAAAT